LVQDANTIVSNIIVNMLELLKKLVMIILLLVRRCSTYHVKNRFELLNTLFDLSNRRNDRTWFISSRLIITVRTSQFVEWFDDQICANI